MIARGTGWDFVRTYDIPQRRRARRAQSRCTATSARSTPGASSFRRWDGSEATAVFANIASAGMSGAIAQRANETTKALGGKVSYLWATFAVFFPWRNDVIRVDGGRHARARAACTTWSSPTAGTSAAG